MGHAPPWAPVVFGCGISPITVTSAHEKTGKPPRKTRWACFGQNDVNQFDGKVFKKMIQKMSLYLVVERFNLFEKYAHASKWESFPQGSG